MLAESFVTVTLLVVLEERGDPAERLVFAL